MTRREEYSLWGGDGRLPVEKGTLCEVGMADDL